jgi:hypothetical protein
LLVDVANKGTKGTTHCNSILLLLESVDPLNVSGPQATIQKFHDGSHFQDRQFCQCVVVIKPATEDQEGFINGYVGEETNYIESDEQILSTKIN